MDTQHQHDNAIFQAHASPTNPHSIQQQQTQQEQPQPQHQHQHQQKPQPQQSQQRQSQQQQHHHCQHQQHQHQQQPPPQQQQHEQRHEQSHEPSCSPAPAAAFIERDDSCSGHVHDLPGEAAMILRRFQIGQSIFASNLEAGRNALKHASREKLLETLDLFETEVLRSFCEQRLFPSTSIATTQSIATPSRHNPSQQHAAIDQRPSRASSLEQSQQTLSQHLSSLEPSQQTLSRNHSEHQQHNHFSESSTSAIDESLSTTNASRIGADNVNSEQLPFNDVVQLPDTTSRGYRTLVSTHSQAVSSYGTSEHNGFPAEGYDPPSQVNSANGYSDRTTNGYSGSTGERAEEFGHSATGTASQGAGDALTPAPPPPLSTGEHFAGLEQSAISSKGAGTALPPAPPPPPPPLPAGESQTAPPTFAASDPVPSSSPQTWSHSLACATCNKTFQNVSRFKAHQLVHTNDRPHACPTCSKRFARKHHLVDHIRVVHHHYKPHECPQCSKSFAKKSTLKRHVETHVSEKPFSCTNEGCSKRFREYANMQHHLQNTHAREDIQCEHCATIIPTRDAVASHMLTHGVPLQVQADADDSAVASAANTEYS